MQIIHRLDELRKARAGLTRGKLALVPTMGALHEGHLTLVREARSRAEHVAVSIFVNPRQFGANEDLNAYPRQLQRDCELLEGERVDLLWAPSAAEMYPLGYATNVSVSGVSEGLCGAARPGHFDGVATVVCKLFNMVQPDMAVFGEKDYQQLAVIRTLVRDLNLPIEIQGAPIVRAADGLALSSRNGYLSAEQRSVAPALYRSLQQLAERLRSGETDHAALVAEARRSQEAAGFRPDYLEIREASSLRPATADDRKLVLLTAAYLGNTRLIDNLCVER